MTNPDKAFPNRRSERDSNGAHMDIKLMGKNKGSGSTYLLKYLHLLYLTAVAWIKIKVDKPSDNGTDKVVIGDGKPVKPKMKAMKR